MNKHSILLFVILLSFFACKKLEKKDKADKPNIIFIMTDDHTKQALSAYDSTLVKTPHLDQLSEEGIIFNKGFVTNSICAPSRAVILTGKYSHLNGVKDNETAFDSSQLTFPKILKQNGYQTSIVGKWHLRSQPTGFDNWLVLPGQGDYYNPRFIDNGKDTTLNGYVTDIITEKAIEWLGNRDKNQPFMLMVHHKAPHRNWMPALKYLNELEDNNFDVPPTFYDDYEGREHLKQQQLTVADHMSLGYDLKMPCDTCTEAPINSWTPFAFKNRLNRLNPNQLEQWNQGYAQEINEFQSFDAHNTKDFKEWKLQRYLQDYLRCVLSVDESVGKINKFLKENGLEKNTIIVYTSDQGFFLGEHGLFDKRYMYEEAFSTPLIMKYPDMISPGSKSDELVMNLDIAPTFLDLAQLSIPADMQGRSMVPIMSSKNDVDWRSSIYYHYYENVFGVPEHYGIRTDRYKLIRFKTDPKTWELYDLKNDPREIDNLYGDPSYQQIVKTLKEGLVELQKEYGIIND